MGGCYAAHVLMEFGMLDAIPEYRQWYYLHGQRQIGNPAHQHGTCYVHISLELHTALSCMTDCHKRLDLGRHLDGFVPSHEVVQVHDLLGGVYVLLDMYLSSSIHRSCQYSENGR